MAGEAGKGSGRRPTQISREQLDANWDRIFRKKDTNIDAEIQRYSESLPDRDYFNIWTAGGDKQNTRMFRSAMDVDHG